MPAFANLLISELGKTTREVELSEGAHLLGRDATCDVVIDSPFIALEQLRLILHKDRFEVEGMGSSSGTLVVGDESLACGAQSFRYPNAIDLGGLSIEVRRDGAPSNVEATPFTLPEERYHVGDEIARGGMGLVMEAGETALGRTVAMKVIRPEAAAGSVGMHGRFVREARVLGMLEHPNIVPIYELGTDADGELFYTMKKVEGSTLQEVLTGLRDDDEAFAEFTLDRLLSIFLKVGDALAFAHSKGVVHRDLKPENIMIGAFGEVLVMDWGLAKLVGEEEEASADLAPSDPGAAPGLTLDGTVMGSPNYMSPEQASGNPSEIDERSDVYGLGAILYAVLTLRPPVTGTTVNEVLASVRSGSITPPAEAELSTEHLKRVPAALSAVAVRALARDKAERYPSVAALNAEISAHLGGYATTAEKAGAWGQMKLFFKRHRGVSIASCAAAASLLVLAIGGPLAAVRQANLADDARTAERLADERAEDLRAQLYAFEMVGATREASTPGGMPQVEQWRPVDGERDLRGWEWYYAASVADASVAEYPSGYYWPEFAWLPDGSGLALLEDAKAATVWDPVSGRVLHQWHLPDRPEILRMAADGTHLLLASSTEYKMASVTDGSPRVSGSVPEGGTGLSLSLDGRTVAWARLREGEKHNGEVWLWDPTTETSADARRIAIDGRAFMRSIAWHPDGLRLAISGNPSGRLQVIDAGAGEIVVQRTIQSMQSMERMVWSPDGKAIAGAPRGGSIQVLAASDLQPLPAWRGGKEARATALAWNPDGTLLASGGADGVVRVWDLRSGALLHNYPCRDGSVRQLAWSPDGKWIASGAEGGMIRIWDAARLPASPEVFPRQVLDVNIAEWHPHDDRVLLTLQRGGGYAGQVLELPERRLVNHPGDRAKMASWSPDGQRIGFCQLDGSTDALCLTGASQGGERHAISDLPTTYLFCWDPTGEKIACSDNHGATTIYNISSKVVEAKLKTSGGSRPSRRLVWSPGGDLIAAGHPGGKIALHRPGDGALVRELVGHESTIHGLAWGDDGSLLASASEDQTIRLWRAQNGEPVRTLVGHGGGVTDVRWAPGGERIASASLDGTVRVWDPATGYELARLPCDAPMRTVEWAPDGTRLLAGGEGSLKLWDSRPARSVEETARARLPCAERRWGDAAELLDEVMQSDWFGYHEGELTATLRGKPNRIELDSGFDSSFEEIELATRVYSPTPQNHTLSVTCPGSWTVSLRGKEILSATEMLEVSQERRCEVALEAGWNEFVVRHTGARWFGALHFSLAPQPTD